MAAITASETSKMSPDSDNSSLATRWHTSVRSFLDANVVDLVKQMTRREKIELLAGADWWHTTPNSRLDIPGVKVGSARRSDGN